MNPYAARILPCLGRPNQPRFDGFIDLSEGQAKISAPDTPLPGGCGAAYHDDQRRALRNQDGGTIPSRRVCLGNLHGLSTWRRTVTRRPTSKEMANEVRKLETTPQRRLKIVYDPRDGQQRMNHAWDCRVYATGAAIMHCAGRGTIGLHAGLIARAISQARKAPDRWTEEEMASMRKHLDILGATDYASGGDNVTPLR